MAAGPALGSAAPARRLAVVDGGSFVLPYDHGLVLGLVQRGWQVVFFASRTRYNGEFLDNLRGRAGVELVVADVSGTVASRLRGVLAYAGLLAALWRRRREFAAINLQFSVLWPLELPFWWLLRRRLVFTVHNAVPHDFPGLRHRPTQWVAALARRLVFASAATQADFLRRYGSGWAARSVVLPIGLMPVAPGLPERPYAPLPAPQALVFWSTVKPYKGVELFATLARSPAWRAQGLALEVVGQWAAELHPLRDELRSLGVKVVDTYLDTPALCALLARPVLFALPYRNASQSAALFTLLHHGASFLCSDAGDLGDFMRRHALQELLLRERSADAVIACLQHLRDAPGRLALAFAAAQQQSRWDQALAQADAVFDDPQALR
jgi:hypothetical protein